MCSKQSKQENDCETKDEVHDLKWYSDELFQWQKNIFLLKFGSINLNFYNLWWGMGFIKYFLLLILAWNFISTECKEIQCSSSKIDSIWANFYMIKNTVVNNILKIMFCLLLINSYRHDKVIKFLKDIKDTNFFFLDDNAHSF